MRALRGFAVVPLVSFVLLAAGPLVSPPSGAADGEDEEQKKSTHTERVTVTATRLPDDVEDADAVPGSNEVLDREAIERSGVRTVQDLLAGATGTIVYDQVGNFVEKSFDMRGFTSGTGSRVYFDGAPLNDTRNNQVSLALVPLDALARAEIARGSAGAVAGGGAEAGTVQLVSRRKEPFGGSLSVAGGSFGTREVAGDLAHTLGRWDFFLSGFGYRTDGFRENAEGDLTRFSGGGGYDLGGGRSLRLSLIDSSSDFGQPGALTAQELQQDPEAAPYNSLDFGKQKLGLATLQYAGPVGESVTVAANLFFRRRSTESLSTGRSAPIFGGFYIDSDAPTWGTTVQATWRYGGAARRHALTGGLEWLDGNTDAIGVLTPPSDPGDIDPTNPASDNTTDRNVSALFAQGIWRPATRWSLLAGARYDDDSVGYDDHLAGNGTVETKEFSDLSLRAGATWNPEGRYGAWLSYSEGFLPPTAEDLFSFPLFGSNPDLVPEDSSSYETGFRGRWLDRLSLEVAVFRLDTENEIIFDPNSPLGLFGANVNAGETRREGVETTFRGRVAHGLDLFANLTLTNAPFAKGPNEGNEVPLVPAEKLNLGLDAELPARLKLRADWMHVGEQVLDNDNGNTQPDLPAYDVVNARLTWLVPGLGREGERRGFALFVEARNLLDETYATRGIYAFDSITGGNSAFLTPAPGRAWLTGLGWDF